MYIGGAVTYNKYMILYYIGGVLYLKKTGKEFHAIWKNGKPVSRDPKVLLAKNETLLFSDPALDLTDDVTSMLDVAAAGAPAQTD